MNTGRRFIETFVTQVLDMLRALAEAERTFSASLPRYKGFSYTQFHFAQDKRRRQQGFANLRNRGFIHDKKDGTFSLTSRGYHWLQSAGQRYFKKQYPKWDGKWRVVIFDLPRTMGKERVKLLRELKFLGFTMLQESIFVLPYQCQREVSDLCNRLEISDYVDILVAESIGTRELELKKAYDL